MIFRLKNDRRRTRTARGSPKLGLVEGGDSPNLGLAHLVRSVSTRDADNCRTFVGECRRPLTIARDRGHSIANAQHMHSRC